MKKLALAIGVGLLAMPWLTMPVHAQWQLGSSSFEPCWSIANPVRCNGSYRPHNPDVFDLFKRDAGAPQSYWRQR